MACKGGTVTLKCVPKGNERLGTNSTEADPKPAPFTVHRGLEGGDGRPARFLAHGLEGYDRFGERSPWAHDTQSYVPTGPRRDHGESAIVAWHRLALEGQTRRLRQGIEPRACAVRPCPGRAAREQHDAQHHHNCIVATSHPPVYPTKHAAPHALPCSRPNTHAKSTGSVQSRAAGRAAIGAPCPRPRPRQCPRLVPGARRREIEGVGCASRGRRVGQLEREVRLIGQRGVTPRRRSRHSAALRTRFAHRCALAQERIELLVRLARQGCALLVLTLAQASSNSGTDNTS